MTSTGRPRGLAETRTSIGTHGRSTPPRDRNGQSLLDAYVLDLERKRLESSMAHLDRQRERLEGQLRDTRRAMAHLASKRSEVSTVRGPSTGNAPGEPPVNRRDLPGQTMTVEY